MKPVTVLVIDDSAVFQAACQDVLRCIPSFVEVGQAWTGEEGVSMAATLYPDLVLVDIILPGIDGLETCPGGCAPSTHRHWWCCVRLTTIRGWPA